MQKPIPEADQQIVIENLEALANRYKGERDRIEQELVQMTVQAQRRSLVIAKLEAEIEALRAMSAAVAVPAVKPGDQ